VFSEMRWSGNAAYVDGASDIAALYSHTFILQFPLISDTEQQKAIYCTHKLKYICLIYNIIFYNTYLNMENCSLCVCMTQSNKSHKIRQLHL